MKNSKKFKLILNILICILIILIGVVGIYKKSSNMYKNILPDYTLGSDINGSTVLEFEVDDTVNTTYYDKDGNEVDSSKVTEKNKGDYEKKETPVNQEEDLNIENYNKVIKIMEKRLSLLNTAQYEIYLDEETGKILLSIEDNYIEDVKSILPIEGKLQLIDSNTEDIIIDYTDFKTAEASYASLTNEVRVYIQLKLNESGLEKIKDIDKYKTVEVLEDKKDTEEVKDSKLKIMFDTEKIAEVSYNDILLDGKTLRITTARELTSDSEINSEININAMASEIATIGKLPVIYNLTAEEFVKNDIANYINYIIVGITVICVVASIALIIRYGVNGILSVIGFITNISIFLIIIRITRIQISLNSFAGIIGLIVLNIILNNNILKAIKNKDKIFTDNIKIAYLRTLDALVIMLIVFLVFSFSNMTVINTMGLLLFWGWIITGLGTLIFTVPMLSIKNNK